MLLPEGDEVDREADEGVAMLVLVRLAAGVELVLLEGVAAATV